MGNKRDLQQLFHNDSFHIGVSFFLSLFYGDTFGEAGMWASPWQQKSPQQIRNTTPPLCNILCHEIFDKQFRWRDAKGMFCGQTDLKEVWRGLGMQLECGAV